MPSATPSAAERLATILFWLCRAVAARSAGGALAVPLIILIWRRINDINNRIARLVALLRTGGYTPRRRRAPPRSPTLRRPRRPSPLPRKFGWLLPLVPESRGYRSQLEYLLRDPEMVELIAAAPAALARPLRSLCWMLLLPPPTMPKPPPPTAPPAQAAAAPEPPPPEPPPPQPLPPQPLPPQSPRPRARSAPRPRATPRACGPKLPA